MIVEGNLPTIGSHVIYKDPLKQFYMVSLHQLQSNATI